WPRLRARLAVTGEPRPAFSEKLAALWQRLTARPLVAATAASVVAVALVSAIAAPALWPNDADQQVIAISDGAGEDGNGWELAAYAGSPVAGPTGLWVDPAGAAAQTGGALSTSISPQMSGDFTDVDQRDRITVVTDEASSAAFSLRDASGDDRADRTSGSNGASPTMTDTAAPSPVAGQTALETSGRAIISTSSLAIEVDSVPSAIDQLRTIANSAGGFIETLSTTGGADPDRGNATVRVPGSAFLTTLQRVKELGTVIGESVGSDDVTEQVIDLKARLRSEEAKETSFIELLDRANSVSELLSIERELSRVRTEIERLTGQLSFIEQRVDLATIHVNFGQPDSLAAAPPSASLAMNTRDVEDAVTQVKAMVLQAGGEVDSTSISLNNGVLQAFVAVRVLPATFDDMLFRAAQLGDVTAKEVRQPGATSDLPESDEATARITVTLNQSESTRNWWIWAGAPGAALAVVLLLAVTYRIGRARNRS
ncbi:MAG: DUF4349 domain-containing protein, partial [Chloroflexi bacterium]|nr:DUF4349 domain-containing protein [Chloroflexota bacterium]